MSPISNKIMRLEDLDISGKKVFIRLDLNVPLSDPDSTGKINVEDDNRIRAALPTIKFAIEKKAKVILASHLGRPKGAKKEPEFSLEPVAIHLAELLSQEVTLADDCIGDGIELLAHNLKPGHVLLLENLRYHKGEEGNDPEFCRRLAKLTDVYITDAFGTAHRKHASTYGLPATIETKGMGFLIEKELKYLDPLLENPAKPFFTILGGAKVSDKIKTIESLLRRVNGLLIGGAMAYAFTAAKGEQVPQNAKQPSPNDIEAAKSIIREAEKKNIPIFLPIDAVEAFDIGPKTIELFKQQLSKAKTVFWNGPVGWFEKDQYAKGTHEIAKHLATQKQTLKVVGGGDTVAAIIQFGLDSQFDHLSTGGGAVLEYLEGNGLPGIEILKSTATQQKNLL